jgi:hypothetical protein
MGAAMYSIPVMVLSSPVKTPHYNGTAVVIGSCVFLALLAAVVLIARGGRRR